MPRGGSVEERVLERLRPTSLQLRILARVYGLIRSRLEPCLAELGLEARVEAVGSYAKGTLLSDKWEVDVFALIRGVDHGWIDKHARGILEGCTRGLPVIAKYSQHPYVTLTMMGVEADIVPARWIDDPREARGVERTPFHTRWVRERLTPGMADEVRLLKSFLKGIGVYGAETARGGFSGYLAEVLTIGYKSFRGVLEEASTWKPPVMVDPHGVGDPARLARRYRDSVLVIPDPVDPSRNVAAAVSRRSLATLILAARIYLKAPGKWYFHLTPRPIHPPEAVPPVAGLCIRGPLYLEPPQDVEGRLARLSAYLATKLGEMGFAVLHHGFSWDGGERAIVYVALESLTLPRVEGLRGPEAWSSMERVSRFIDKRLREGGAAWVGDGSLMGYRPRRVRSAREALLQVASQAPLPRGASRVEVVECPGGGCIGWCGREALRGADPTPAWLRLAYSPGKPRY